MKSLGWQMFFSLVLADAVALIMVALHVAMRIVLIVSGVVFVILAIVMFFQSRSRERSRRREEVATAKIAELQGQVDEAMKTKDGAAV